ncbi:hypothetical protein Bca101_012635 [Brassica carinata]
MAGARCPFAHKIARGFESRTSLDSPRFVEWLASNVYMGAVDPPIDQTLKTLYLCRLNSNVNDQHIRERFSPYGEIESIVYFAMRGSDGAFLTYTTRLAAEKAMLEHPSWVLMGSTRDPQGSCGSDRPKDSKPLKVYARKRQRSNNGGEGPSLSKEGDGVSKQLGEPSAGGGWETNTGDDDDVKTSGEADNAWGGKPNAGASSSSGSWRTGDQNSGW